MHWWTVQKIMRSLSVHPHVTQVCECLRVFTYPNTVPLNSWTAAPDLRHQYYNTFCFHKIEMHRQCAWPRSFKTNTSMGAQMSSGSFNISPTWALGEKMFVCVNNLACSSAIPERKPPWRRPPCCWPSWGRRWRWTRCRSRWCVGCAERYLQTASLEGTACSSPLLTCEDKPQTADERQHCDNTPLRKKREKKEKHWNRSLFRNDSVFVTKCKVESQSADCLVLTVCL